MKSKQNRFDAAVNYLHQKVSSDLAQHIVQVARAGNVSQSTLGGDLSLGSRSDSRDDDDYDDATEQRKALRALLLCQRVYFSKIWSENEIAATVGVSASFVKVDRFTRWKDLKADSLSIWGFRAESEIIEGIKTFTITSNRALDAVKAARQAGDASLSLPALGLRRSDNPFPGHGTCYSAVMFWLFRAGLVSYRWMMLNSKGALDTPGLKRAFGNGRIIWSGDRPFGEKDDLPSVPHGYIVHLYVDNAMQWKGHWLISAGDGTAYGRNNDDEGGRVDRFYGRCNLNRQFMAYKEKIKNQRGEDMLLKGVAEIFDPLEIPNRI